MPSRLPLPPKLALALAALRAGEAIGLPTETVYGLAADARNPAAVRKIFALKGRPADHPLIVHIADARAITRFAQSVPETAEKLTHAFWPGPLTIILKKRADVPDEVTGGQDTVGLRCPNHPVALALLQAFDSGLAAPSANRFGRISPTLAEHVQEEFGAAVPIVLDGGACAVGLESTIVDLSTDLPRILRPGYISQAQIEAVIGPVAVGSASHSPRASGTLAAHYAPRTPMRLLPRAELLQQWQTAQASGTSCALFTIDTLPPGGDGLVLPSRPTRYGHDLYAVLRRLDSLGVELLFVEQPPNEDAWLAINDRLNRAAVGAGGVDDAP